MMVTQYQVGFLILLLIFSVVFFALGYTQGICKGDERKNEKKHEKLKLIEGIDGVTSVQLTPIRYVELLTKEEECNELKLAIKRFADETPKGT